VSQFVPSLIHRICEFRVFDCAQTSVRYPHDQMLTFGSPDVGVAKTRLVWVVAPLPAPRHVTGLILVPSSG
jgi:hypothetical protein